MTNREKRARAQLGYTDRVVRLADELTYGPGDVFSVSIVHAADCPMPRGLGPCQCTPEICARNTRTGAVVEVNEEGDLFPRARAS
jgi:hypothetical protein